jgi:uncharacterized protein YcgL (UPF0745 family)
MLENDEYGQIIIIHQPEMLSHFGVIPLTMIPGFGHSEVVIICPLNPQTNLENGDFNTTSKD